MTANVQMQRVTVCNICGLVQAVGAPAPQVAVSCRRCGKILRWVKLNTRWRTGTCALAALLLVFPAYFHPLASVNYLGNFNQVTMLSLIGRLFEMQHFLIGGFVLLTVIVAPVARTVALGHLSVTLRFDRWRTASRMLHEIVLVAGPWDMAPMFLVALAVGIVKFGAAGSVQTGGGALAFVLMVAAARCAVISFDGASAWEGRRR